MSTFLASGQKGRSGLQQGESPRSATRRSFMLRVGKFKDDQSGNLPVLFGLTACISFAALGAAVDVGRAMQATRITKAAVDSAVLAGARVLQVKGSSASAVQEAKDTAARYYTQNVEGRLPLASHTATFKPVDNNTAFSGVVVAKIATPALHAVTKNLHMSSVFGLPDIPTLDVKADAEAELAIGSNAETNLEISLMLDTSGSMDGQKIIDMQTAAKDLVDIVVWTDQSQYTSKVSLAPFSADVRLPLSWNAAARGSNPAPTLSSLQSVCTGRGNNRTCVDQQVVYAELSDCVVERHGTDKFTDVNPATGGFVTSKYNGNGSCSQDSSNEVSALSNNKTVIKNKIDDLVIGGGTAGHLGTAWAWYTLSPNWNSVTGVTAASYTSTSTKKIAVLMTDGEYNTQYKAVGTSGTSPNGNSVDQAKSLCTAMKAKGIEVYTVGFDLGGNSTALSTLSFCANDAAHFYDAADGDELKAAFRDIALKLSQLYIRK